ncbi:MAG: hypothetical protein GY797_03620, partial [Deltaproteobacteria bacterium]|nr:hypothetical protein [Deltaproteobacteria bacterium]
MMEGDAYVKKTIPGYYTTVPINKTRTGTQPFHSLIEFFAFIDNGQSYVYAVGSPVDSKASIRADYENKIDYVAWPYVTGKEEVSLIEEIYARLSKLDSSTGRSTNTFKQARSVDIKESNE